MLKKAVVFILMLALSASAIPVSCRAAAIKISSDGKIPGEKFGYSFYLPAGANDITEFTYADRGSVTGSQLVEKVTIYCAPNAGAGNNYPRYAMFTYYIYKKFGWKEKTGMTEILRTKDYVFVYQSAAKPSFESTHDEDVYKYCMQFVGSAELVKSMFSMPKEQPAEYLESIFVNNKLLLNKVVYSGPAIMLPYREVAEALGAKVTWDAKNSIVSMKKGDISDSFYIDSKTQRANGYVVKLINGRTYIAYGYFYVMFGKSMSIKFDTSKNAYITTN